jgi:hypothetical protein
MLPPMPVLAVGRSDSPRFCAQTIAPYALVVLSTMFLPLGSACNRTDREPSPAPSASPAEVPAVPSPHEPPAPSGGPLTDASLPAKAQQASITACTTDADCRTFSDSCTICNCRPLAKSAPDPKCAGKGMTCLIDPCSGLRSACRKGNCVIGEPSDAAAKDSAPSKDAPGDVAAKSPDVASKGSDAAASPAVSATPKASDAAARN